MKMLCQIPRLAALCLAIAASTTAFGADNSSAQPAPEEILKLAEQQQPQLLETLEKLVNIDSGTGDEQGLAQVENILVDRLKALGATVETQPAETSGGNSIIGTLKGSGEAKIMLMVHYDTVFTKGEAEKRPFRRDGNRLYGPGVADAKGGAVVMLHGVEVLNEIDFDGYGTLTLFFNPDEEKGSIGSRELIGELAGKHDYVLSYEPPDRDIVAVATNGINYVFVDVKGKSSHAGSAPDQGRNAITELSHQLLQLQDLGDPEKQTTVNWTIVEGGSKRNIIPAQAKAEGDMRYSDYSETKRVINDATAIIKNQKISDTKVEFRLERGRTPLSPNAATKELAALAQTLYKDIGLDLGTGAMGFGTDAGYAYSPDNPNTAVLETLGPMGKSLHSEDEYVLVDSIAPRVYLTVRMVMALSQQN